MKQYSDYRHIVWDWNGTLLDDAHLVIELADLELVKSGVSSRPIQDHRHHYCHPVSEYYRKLGIDFELRPFELVTESFHNAYGIRWRECTLHNGAAEALLKFRALGISQTIISAHGHDAVREQVEHYGIFSHFEQVLGLPGGPGGSKVKMAKEWSNLLSITPRQILVIGDTIHDFEVASELGADCLLISRGVQDEKVLQATGSPVIESLHNLFSTPKKSPSD